MFHATRPIPDKHTKPNPPDNDQLSMYIEPRRYVPNVARPRVLLLFDINAMYLIDKILKPDQKPTGLFL